MFEERIRMFAESSVLRDTFENCIADVFWQVGLFGEKRIWLLLYIGNGGLYEKDFLELRKDISVIDCRVSCWRLVDFIHERRCKKK